MSTYTKQQCLDEITKVSQATIDIKNAIVAKGVEVPDSTTLAQYKDKIAAIPTPTVVYPASPIEATENGRVDVKASDYGADGLSEVLVDVNVEADYDTEYDALEYAITPEPRIAFDGGGTTSTNTKYPTVIGGNNYTSLSSPIYLKDYSYGPLTQISFYGNTTMTTAEFPTEDITKITYAFQGCTGLTEVPECMTEFFENRAASGKSISIIYLFYGCTGLTSVDFKGMKANTATNVFNGCTGLKEVKNLDTSSATTFASLFKNCSSLLSVDLDCSSISAPNSANYGGGCTSLQNVYLRNLGKAFSGGADFSKASLAIAPLYGTAFSREAILGLFDVIYDISGGTFNYAPTLQLHQDTYNALSEEDIAIATAKGWTVTYYATA